MGNRQNLYVPKASFMQFLAPMAMARIWWDLPAMSGSTATLNRTGGRIAAIRGWPAGRGWQRLPLTACLAASVGAAQALDACPDNPGLPPFPYAYVGEMAIGDDPPSVVLERDGQTLAVSGGSLVGDGYRLDAIGDERLELTYLPFNCKRVIDYADLQNVSATGKCPPPSPSSSDATGHDPVIDNAAGFGASPGDQPDAASAVHADDKATEKPDTGNPETTLDSMGRLAPSGNTMPHALSRAGAMPPPFNNGESATPIPAEIAMPGVDIQDSTTPPSPADTNIGGIGSAPLEPGLMPTPGSGTGLLPAPGSSK